MKITYFLKILLSALLISLSLFLMLSCNKTPDTSDDEEGDNGQSQIIDRTNPTSGNCKIRFYLGNTPTYITHYYNKGETITPPTDLPSYNTTRENIYFDGWEGVDFKTVEKDATYCSRTRSEYNYYTATFVVGEEKVEVKTICGDFPKVPDISTIPLAEGEQFVAWDTTMEAFETDITISAITTRFFDPKDFLDAYNRPLLKYTSIASDFDNNLNTLENAVALTSLLIEENQNPGNKAVIQRIVSHFVSVVTKDQAPAFDACCFWSYAPHSGAIALAKATPTVWNAIPDDIKLRLDTMMQAFAYLESYATSDSNDYQTGPGMRGNFGKNWNPNYRLANVPVMIYVTHYFGNGDMLKGTEAVNTLLKGFNESVYDGMITTFQKYGWRRATITWTKEGVTANNGIVGESAKTLLLRGGQAVGEDTSNASDKKVPLGFGVGVTNAGADYQYKEFRLNEADGIIRSLLMFNYGTGDLTRTAPRQSTFLAVQSNHFYDVNGDGRKELVAYIVGENSTSPYEGQYGMMKEFASGDRSSTAYCSHDFVLVTSMLMTCKVLGIYDITKDTYTDKNGTSLIEAILVGNEDFLFKNEQGYHGYATGSYGVSDSVHSEKDEHEGSYFAMKSLWRKVLKVELEKTITI